MAENKTVTEVGIVNLHIDGDYIPNIHIFEIKGSYVFKGETKNMHYYTPQQFEYNGEVYPAESIRLYPMKSQNMTVEGDILPLFKGEEKTYQLRNKTTGDTFNKTMTFKPLEKPSYLTGAKFTGTLS